MGIFRQKKMRKKKKKKKYNKLKFIKSLARVFFSNGMNMSTKPHKDKNKYSRKKKHKKRLDNDD